MKHQLFYEMTLASMILVYEMTPADSEGGMPKGDDMKKTTCAEMTCAPEPADGISAPVISGFPASPRKTSRTKASRTAMSRLSVLRISALIAPAIAAVAISVAACPERALAEAGDGPVLDMPFEMTWPVTGSPGMAGSLPPADILAEVRREGFYPVSRPVHRGRVYVLFAVDQDDMDVKLTVDAASGRVLWVAEAVAHLGGPGHYGYRTHWRAEHPNSEHLNSEHLNSEHSPPVESANAASESHHGSRTSHKRFPPLPRSRPVDLAEPEASAAEPSPLLNNP
jgi:hypothetical protein